MKAISIKQPWASLIAHGIKNIENRTWKCPQKLDKTSKRWHLMAHPWLHVAFFMDTIGLLLLGMGLFSSQWICFLIVLAMSFSQTQKLGAWAVFLDSLVTVIVYAFAILNAYHLA